jgi:peptide/nickel transport system substrate-binding protein
MNRAIPILLLPFFALAAPAAQELRFCLSSEPATFDPVMVDDESSEAIRYLTGGVLIKVNRQTQQLEPELAVSWTVTEGGRTIVLRLREKVEFSDGTPFSADDVAYTFHRLMDPALHSPTGDAFRSGDGQIESAVNGPYKITLRFPAPIAGLDRLFDQVAIMSAHSPKKESAVLGPFHLREYKAGSYVALERNPRYWKRDAAGRALPYLDSIRLDIQQNREMELLRFERGELHLINALSADHFDRLAAKAPTIAQDAGPGMDSEFFWFNQAPAAPIAIYKKAWFQSKVFRRAISESIGRQDICRIVYRGHASPAYGPVSPANRFWFDSTLKAPVLDPEAALRELNQAGFQFSGGALRDRDGHRVEFTIVTNSGNQARERTAAMMQQDLTKIGIKLNVATLDFPSLLERMNRTLDYDAVLLGLVNVDLDPNLQMNIWLSSSSMHAWHPKQANPETDWEAEIDNLMRVQASQLDLRKRKAAFARVQQIVAEQAPIIYLVNKNVLSAISPSLKNAHPVVLRPQAFWNAERMTIEGPVLQSSR